MKRYLDDLVLKDLATKTVVLTGPRQVGKTTLSRQLMQSFDSAQYLNWEAAGPCRIAAPILESPCRIAGDG